MLHYATDQRVATFVMCAASLAGPRLARRARHGGGRRTLRACRDRRPPVDAREPPGALRRPVRALGRRDRRRADLDPRLAVRERAARPRARDRGGRDRAANDGCMRFGSRLPNDTAMLTLLAVVPDRRPRRSRTGSATVPATTRSRSRSSARSSCCSIYASWLRGYIRSERGRVAHEEGADLIAAPDRRSSCSPLQASARRSSPTGSSRRSTRRSRRSGSRRRSPAS